MRIYAIDPGPEKSAWVYIEQEAGTEILAAFDYQANADIDFGDFVPVAIEMIESYGMAVGAETFQTCVAIGEFRERFGGPRYVTLIGRKAVKLNLCGSARAKDANIRQAIIDRYGGPAAIRKGGPLYKVSSHIWAALAVGLTYLDQQKIGGKL